MIWSSSSNATTRCITATERREMWEVVRQWFHRYFSDPQAVVLLVLLAGGFSIVLFMGDMLKPVLAALVIAYLLEGLVRILARIGVTRRRGVILVFSLFMALL